MGCVIDVRCKKCEFKFSASLGGGMRFHKLRCDKCGKSKEISFDELGELHYRYLKGSSGPYSTATMKHDKYVQDNFTGEPISYEEYHAEIEKRMKECKCGGKFTFKAKPRCPFCNSDDFDEIEGGPIMFYD
ncbi:hypothetical protein [Marinifilum flexuosum]|uniref:hypothetical protein n=1 Tax=Marinifilum flexuosum TaxID=1117708 RepID=UPI00248F8CB2|nr:hypothetical protein [Marinifilum flexuosum]